MVQVINDPNRQSAGNAIGSSLGTALQGLASNKIGQMQQQKQQAATAQGLQSLFNIPTQEAQSLALLDPSILDQVVKQKLAEPGQQAYNQSLQSLLGGSQQPMQQQAPAQQQPQAFNPSTVSQDQRNELAQFLQSPEAQKSLKPEELKLLSEFSSSPFAEQVAPQEKAPLLKGGLNERQATELTKLGLQEKQHQEKLGLEKEKMSNKERSEALKETKELRKDLFAKKKAAQETIESIDRLEELEKEGLPGPGYMEFLTNAGLDIPSLVGAPAEEYNKIAANFIRNAKSLFGSRLTDQDLKQFLKTVPSLSNSPEGRKRINANLKRIANLDKSSLEVYADIVKENKGIPPFDIELEIDKRLEKKRDSIYKQFKQDLKKEVPEGESALATTLLTGAGKLIGNLPKAALGAAGGAWAGKSLGPYGILAGGIGGGLAGLLGAGLPKISLG